jgi:hypothetical protein
MGHLLSRCNLLFVAFETLYHWDSWGPVKPWESMFEELMMTISVVVRVAPLGAR